MPESFFNKVEGLKASNLIKKETLAQVFSCEFCEISKATFSTEYLRTTASALLLSIRKDGWMNY